jgi:hypothetical protein
LIPTLQLGQFGRAQRGPVVAEAISLYAALVSFWEFEDNNGTSSFTDSRGSNHLTMRDGTGSFSTATGSTASGLVARAMGPTGADWTAYVPRSNTALDIANSSFTVLVWSKGTRAQSDASALVWSRMGSGAGGSVHVGNIQTRSTDGLFVGTLFDSGAASVQPVSSIAASSTHWSLTALSLDRAGNLLTLRVYQNGSSDKDSLTFSNAVQTAASNANFCFSDWLYNDNTYNSSASRHLTNGVYDQAMFLTKYISDDEFTYLVNSGAGKSYADLLAESGN